MKTLLALLTAAATFMVVTPEAEARDHRGHGRDRHERHHHGRGDRHIHHGRGHVHSHYQPSRRLVGYCDRGLPIYSHYRIVRYDRYRRPVYDWVCDHRGRIFSAPPRVGFSLNIIR